MKAHQKKTIGILGGMGASASAYFFSKLVEKLQAKGLKEDQDFPEMILYNLPLKGLNADGHLKEGYEDYILNQLLAGAKKLKKAGADFLVIPCNSVHGFFIELQENLDIPIINIISQTAKALALANYKKVGILATETTKIFRLYEQSLSEFGIETIWPVSEDQQRVNSIIAKTTAGKNTKDDANDLERISEKLFALGAERIVLGCTDLPIVAKDFSPKTKKELFVDTCEILAEAAAEISLGNTMAKLKNKF